MRLGAKGRARARRQRRRRRSSVLARARRARVVPRPRAGVGARAKEGVASRRLPNRLLATMEDSTTPTRSSLLPHWTTLTRRNPRDPSLDLPPLPRNDLTPSQPPPLRPLHTRRRFPPPSRLLRTRRRSPLRPPRLRPQRLQPPLLESEVLSVPRSSCCSVTIHCYSLLLRALVEGRVVVVRGTRRGRGKRKRRRRRRARNRVRWRFMGMLRRSWRLPRWIRRRCLNGLRLGTLLCEEVKRAD